MHLENCFLLIQIRACITFMIKIIRIGTERHRIYLTFISHIFIIIPCKKIFHSPFNDVLN